MSGVVSDLIGRDFKKTGHCDFDIAKKIFMTTDASLFATPKNWPYNREISIAYIQ